MRLERSVGASWHFGQFPVSDKQCLHAMNTNYYTFKLHSRSLLVNILQLILNVRQLWRHFRRNTVTSLPQSARKLQNFAKLIAWVFLLPHFACTLVWLFWMYNKTIFGFGLRMISRIIQTSVNVIRLSLLLRQITLTSVWIIPVDIMLSLIQYLFIKS